MEYPPELVSKVNEIYHDISAKYKKYPSGMIKEEGDRWRRIAERVIAKNTGEICILDIGSGTGLVPLQISEFLKPQDEFIVSDISLESLDVCKENLENKNFKCTFKYLKAEGTNIDLESDKCDYITLNSVLHHIMDYSEFFREINRLLKAGGYLIIGHEPNKFFFSHKFLWKNYMVSTLLLNPKQFCIDIAMRVGSFEMVRKTAQNFMRDVRSYNDIVSEVNARLIDEKIISEPLTASRMIEIVDIWSPTAGGYHKNKGFDVFEIIGNYLPDFEIEYMETYNHLGKSSLKNRAARAYDSFLKKRFPKEGSEFFAAFRKKR